MTESNLKTEIKEIEINKLTPHPKNPNTHPVDQIDALVKSMDKYTQYYPIIVDENLVILCGHGKKMALEKMGRKTAEVRVMYGLSEKQKLKLLIEDNKIQSLSYTNYDKIEEIIKEVGETDVIGFPVDYLKSIVLENSIDNMGVDFSVPAKKEDKATQEVKYEQQEEFNMIDNGIQKATIIKCPHCGKEIVK